MGRRLAWKVSSHINPLSFRFLPNLQFVNATMINISWSIAHLGIWVRSANEVSVLWMISWKALEGPWRTWQAVEGPWRPWKTLRGPWWPWKTLERFFWKEAWKSLETLEDYWKALEGKAFGGSKGSLKALEDSWKALAGLWRPWETLD